MKGLLGLIVMVIVVAACNNSGKSENVGDSLNMDPTTAQPITTEPDTVGPGVADTSRQAP